MRSVQRLSHKKLHQAMAQKGLNLSGLAKQCGISRQSIYAMLRGASIFNKPFTKMLQALGTTPGTITEEESVATSLLSEAPLKIQKTALALVTFCESHHASLLLFGSRAQGKNRPSADWDFGVFFNDKEENRSFVILKQKLIYEAFPYKIDIVGLNHAPTWFQKSILEDALLVAGPWPTAWSSAA